MNRLADFIRYWPPTRRPLIRLALLLRGTRAGEALAEYLVPADAVIRFRERGSGKAGAP